MKAKRGDKGESDANGDLGLGGVDRSAAFGLWLERGLRSLVTPREWASVTSRARWGEGDSGELSPRVDALGENARKPSGVLGVYEPV